MSKIKDNGGAIHPIYSGTECLHEGISLRDYFAAKAMQAGIETILKLQPKDSMTREEIMRTVAESAYMQADAMLTQRTKHEAESDG